MAPFHRELIRLQDTTERFGGGKFVVLFDESSGYLAIAAKSVDERSAAFAMKHSGGMLYAVLDASRARELGFAYMPRSDNAGTVLPSKTDPLRLTDLSSSPAYLLLGHYNIRFRRAELVHTRRRQQSGGRH